MNNNIEDFDQINSENTENYNLETLTGVTDNENTTGFTSETGTPPTEDKDFVVASNAKSGNSRNMKVIGGGIAAAAILGLGALFFSSMGDGDQNTQNNTAESAEVVEPVAVPTLGAEEDSTNTATSETEKQSASDLEVSKNTEQSTGLEQSVEKQEPQINIAASTPVINEQKNTESINKSQNVTQNEDKVSSVQIVDINTAASDVVPAHSNVVSNSTKVLEPAVIAPTLGNEVGLNNATVAASEKNREVESVDSNKEMTEAEKLRAEANKMLAQAKALESQSKLDAVLAGKTQEEQITYLKERMAQVEQEIANRNVCKAPQKKNLTDTKTKTKNKTKAHSAKKSVKNTSHKRYQVTGIVEGQIWVNVNGNSRSYVKGDKLPNGSTIKKIDYDSKTITTDKGVFKVH